LFLTAMVQLGIAQGTKGKNISQEDWEMRSCSFDSTANALVLLDVGSAEVHFNRNYCSFKISDFSVLYERHLRIKILNEQGLDAGKLSIILRSVDGNQDELTFFGGTISWQEKEKVLTQKFNKKVLTKTCFEDRSCSLTAVLPGIRANCIVDVYYTINTKILSDLPIWTFSHDIPVVYSEFKTSMPAFFVYRKQCSLIGNLGKESFTRYFKDQIFCPSEGHGIYYDYNFPLLEEKYWASNVAVDKSMTEDRQFRCTIESVDFQSVLIKKSKIVAY